MVNDVLSIVNIVIMRTKAPARENRTSHRAPFRIGSGREFVAGRKDPKLQDQLAN